jgi:hypothetical protein
MEWKKWLIENKDFEKGQRRSEFLQGCVTKERNK